MADDRNGYWDTSDQNFTVDEILAELTSSPVREGDVVAPKRSIPVSREPAPQPDPPSRPAPKRAKKEPSEPVDEKIIHFPGHSKTPPPVAEESPASAPNKRAEGPEDDSLLTRVIRRADRYASHMWENAEPDAETKKAEQYMPGVDRERPSAQRKVFVPRRRRVRVHPDTSPRDLAVRYGKGLGSLRVRRFLLFFLALPLLYLHLVTPFALPLPAVLAPHWIQLWICAGIQAAALGLSYDLVASAFTKLGIDTLIVSAALATLADACTMNLWGDRNGSFPYTLVSVLALALGLWGKYMKQLTLRTTCRTAHAAKTPYLVTLDENKWDGRAVFSKWSGTTEGFGSQIQSDDGAMRIFRPIAGILILAAVLFSAIASVGKGRPELFVWCLSTMLCAAASFSGALAFPLPFRLLSRRLTRAGAALAGWEGIRRQAKKSCIQLTDTDLFPPGSVSLNGVKVFQNYPLDKVISVTATLIRHSGSGLERTFHELLHSQGAIYRKAEQVQYHEGGISAVIRGEQVWVGSSAFMHMMEVTLPQGLNVKNAVFCAIEGELAGIFALSYALHSSVRPSLYALIDNKIAPILATRDFSLIPAMLHQRFKLPAERMAFPEHDRRRSLSDPERKHDRPLVCVLCREGIGPLAEAIVGAKRLNLATRINAVLAVIGSIIGLLLAFYLTSEMAFGSLSVFNMLVFLLMWMVPTLLVSGWINRY